MHPPLGAQSLSGGATAFGKISSISAWLYMCGNMVGSCCSESLLTSVTTYIKMIDGCGLSYLN